MKYYMVNAYTPYCGEDRYEYLEVSDDYDYHRVELWAEEVCDNNAFDWWDEKVMGDYDENYDNYRSECGWDLWEIAKEEYEIYA